MWTLIHTENEVWGFCWEGQPAEAQLGCWVHWVCLSHISSAADPPLGCLAYLCVVPLPQRIVRPSAAHFRTTGDCRFCLVQ